MASASSHFSQIAGIIGGVGPEATTYFMSLIIKLRQTFASKDQDHIPFLVFNNPQIPDRTEYLINGSENPLPQLIHTAKILKKAGATFLTIPCNTAHAFISEIEETVGLEVINMVSLSLLEVVKHYGKKAKIGLLATDGTIQSHIYQDARKDIAPQSTIITPFNNTQKLVMEAIYGEKGIKSISVNSYNVSLLYDASQELLERGAQVIIAGCTEVPLALNSGKPMFPILDPMEIAAKEVIKRTLASKVEKLTSLYKFHDHK